MMSDYAFVAERAKKAFASVARLESELARNPEDRAILINLSAMRRLAEQARLELERLAVANHIEVCQYRLVPEYEAEYGLRHVSSSLYSYQVLFTQIYDAFRNGPKDRARFGQHTERESMLDFAYSYSGSLGVVLLAKSQRDFFSGNLDKSIDALYQIMDINNVQSVREIAHDLGRAVVKRVHDWSDANVKGGFATDIRWKLSGGAQRGQMIDVRRLEGIAGFIGATADTSTTRVITRGILIAGNVQTRSFRIGELDGAVYSGHIPRDVEMDAEMTLGRMYEAEIDIEQTYHYATEETKTIHLLKKLVGPVSS